MAITTSAKKAIRASARKKAFNDYRRRSLRMAVRGAREAAPKGGADAAAALSAAYKAIDKAQKRGLMKKNTAARKKSQMARLLGTKQS